MHASLRFCAAVSSILIPLGLCAVGNAQATVRRVAPLNDLADGMEISDSLWISEGLSTGYFYLAVGYENGPDRMEPAFIYPAPGIVHGDSIAYARLKFSCLGSNLTEPLSILIRGLLDTSGAPFTQERRPSQVPATQVGLLWTPQGPWPFDGPWDPVYTVSPNIAPVVNELICSDLWPAHGFGAVALSLEVIEPYAGVSVMARMADSGNGWPPVQLEIYPELADAFDAPPLLGRPTDTSITLNFSHLLPLDCYVAYGSAPGQYDFAQGATRTAWPEVDPLCSTPADSAIEIELTELQPDTRHFGRLFFRRAGRVDFEALDEFSFHTARPSGATFTFDITADSHLEDRIDDHVYDDVALYQVALENLVQDDPDFVIDLGDLAVTLEVAVGVQTAEEARRIYQEQRQALGRMSRPLPFYLALGNHEGEVGWLSYVSNDGIYPWSTRARLEYIPNPHPDAFYSGNPQPDPELGPIEDYYAWEWGDALFVVLDPFRYTMTKPHRYGGGGSGNAWDWTLGQDQYEWLAAVLEKSNARWKFIFTHHLVGGVREAMWGHYGRGGIEAVRHWVAGNATYEWGGEDEEGSPVFDKHRPGWDRGDIHSLLVEHEVAAVFHAHDHCYVMQQLDGIVYQVCPLPNQANYGTGVCALGQYSQGVFEHNSGHLRVTVAPENVTVAYVRAYLPGEGPNGEVSQAYQLNAPGAVFPGPAVPAGPRLSLRPLPCSGVLWLDFLRPGRGAGEALLLDALGRLRAREAVSPDEVAPRAWRLAGPDGRLLPAGPYWVRYRDASGEESHRVLVVR